MESIKRDTCFGLGTAKIQPKYCLAILGNELFYPANLWAQIPPFAMLLLPLKYLAYGVVPHVFSDYFQYSKTFARVAMDKFERAICMVYTLKYHGRMSDLQ